MTQTRVVALVSVVVAFFASSIAFAGEKGLVSNAGGILKVEPKPKAKKGDKLKQGIMIDVVDHSADGLWVKVVAPGADGNIEGWVEKNYVRSLSRYGFSWERKSVAGGNPTTGKPPVTADPPVTGTTKDPVPATDEGWGKETPVEDTSNSEWDKTAEPEATATPAAGATPTPAADEGWGTEEVDLTK